ncbi:hypothetical protein BPC006_I2211 [Burkholderia pseudomallei BPC006]|nr:hypothetical protein BPC006_I2211 [Burkholderia pseudomallei BPC006]
MARRFGARVRRAPPSTDTGRAARRFRLTLT